MPFEDDAICQALFAATEELGRPDAFLARELADAVVHFLAQEIDEEAPSTAHIAELVIKVVRELGQPAIAHAFAERQQRLQAVQDIRQQPNQGQCSFSLREGPNAAGQACLQAYALQAVFSPDLAAAHQEQLIVLGGLDSPATLAAAAVDGPTAARGLPAYFAALDEAVRTAGQCLVLDSPEWLASTYHGQVSLDWFCQSLLESPRLVARQLIVNVHCLTPPIWALAREAGPLFPSETGSDQPRHAADFLTHLLAHWPARQASSRCRLDWHLSSADLEAEPGSLLRTVLGLAVQGEAVGFVFDRPRQPIALAEGMDRQHPAVLLEVSLMLDTFLRRPGIDGDGARFLEKLPSLTRMAVSAGAQKRRFLRRQAEGSGFARGFLLDRARLAVVPRGLDSVVRHLTGQGAAGSPLAAECAQRIVATLASGLADAGRQAHLECGLDSPSLSVLPRSGSSGLDVADVSQPPKKQLQAAGKLHALAGRGTARIHFSRKAEFTVDSLFELLRYAWKRTDVLRVCFHCEPAALRQPELTELAGGSA
jgi:hypothetical protein